MKSAQKAHLASWPESINITQLKETFGAPAWLVNEAQIISNINEFSRFTGANNRIFYPVKTNPSLVVLQVLGKMGVGADCASSAEIDLALYAGIQIENISYNSPAQDIDVCIFLLKAGGRVVMDDKEALDTLQQELKPGEIKGKLFLRINLPEYVSYAHKNDNQDLMAHGHSSSKFGIPAEEVEALLQNLSLPVSGLHIHVGTQMDNLDSFAHALQGLHLLAAQCTIAGHPIIDINLGGGLGIPFTKTDTFPSLAHWCTSLQRLQTQHYTYSVEPGHALVGNAVALLTKILAIKPCRGKKWVIADVGTDQLAKVTLLKWPHRILDETGRPLPTGNDAIAGPLCFAGDVLLDNVSVGHLRKGSALLITEAGAYTYSLSNKFNGRLAPRWVLLKTDGNYVQSLQEETRFDNPQFMHYEWGALGQGNDISVLNLDEVQLLSSPYLKEGCNEDNFSYVKVEKVYSNEYEFTVNTTSRVDFISMPFAIRIFGDAAIVALLHQEGYDKKQISVWGRKLTLDCYNKVYSNKSLSFTICTSAPIVRASLKHVVVRFKTSCGNCAGSILVSYQG
jgi:diaminopimelate decarboxylase